MELFKKRRTVWVCLMIFVAIMIIWSQPSLSQEKVIKIGAIYPLSGNLASTGMSSKRGVELAEDVINNYYDLDLPFARSRGIPNLGNAKIKVIIGDSRGDPKVGMGEAERMIKSEGCVGLVGAYQSSVTKTTSQVAERYGVPYLNSDSSSYVLTQRGFKWYFRLCPSNETWAQNLVSFLDVVKKEKGAKVKTLVILYEDTEWGASSSEMQKKYFTEAGYQILDMMAYSAGATDVNSEVLRVIKANPDVLVMNNYVTDGILYTKTFKNLNYNPQHFLTWCGCSEPAYIPTVGKDGNYFFSYSEFAPELAEKRKVVKQLLDLHRQKYGEEINENTVRAIPAVFLMADAINRARSTEPEKIYNALMATNIPADQLISPWDGIKFDPKSHQNIHARYVIVQILNQQYKTVWPPGLASAKYVWPWPRWDKR
jgi:branched-chain amino acid transport system substrate-binding protein